MKRGYETVSIGSVFMSCEIYRQFVLDHGWDEATRRNAAETLQHLESCVECQHAVQDYDRLRLTLESFAAHVDPPTGWDQFNRPSESPPRADPALPCRRKVSVFHRAGGWRGLRPPPRFSLPPAWRLKWDRPPPGRFRRSPSADHFRPRTRFRHSNCRRNSMSSDSCPISTTAMRAGWR